MNNFENKKYICWIVVLLWLIYIYIYNAVNYESDHNKFAPSELPLLGIPIIENYVIHSIPSWYVYIYPYMDIVFEGMF